MNQGTDLIGAAADGFKRWLTIPELKEHVEAERERVSKVPELFAVAYNQRAGYIKLDLGIIKMTAEVNEEGKLLDIELQTICDSFSEPVKIYASVFQPGHTQIQFCRIFATASDRNSYYEDIRFISELQNDYTVANINQMRRQAGRRQTGK
jgi:hypothetical protein